MASSRTAFTSSGVISGSGLAMAKMIGIFCQGPYHLPGKGPFDGKAEQDIGPVQSLCQGPERGFGGKPLLVRVHALAAPLVNDPLGIAHDDIRLPHAEGYSQVGAGDGGSPGAVDDDPDLFDPLVDNMQGVDERRRGDYCRAVLVVVEDRDVHAFFQFLLDMETLRRLDILQVDPAEGGFEKLADPDHLIRIFRVYLDIEHVDVGEAFEQDPLPFHDRLPCQCPYIAEAQDRGAV